MNGVPGKSFQCKRGVRQGDPLSPLLFVLAADLLQSIINKAASMNLNKHPIGDTFGGDYPIVQYADDTLLFMPADALQLFYLKGPLRSFTDSTGLKVNLGKSFIVPINVPEDTWPTLWVALLGPPHSPIWGLPLGITRPSFTEFMPLLNRIERRMMGINSHLSYSGRLIMVNSLLSATPTSFMGLFKFPVWVIEQIDSY